ncbi:MAG: hypothetical protein JWM31_3003, partial [Solirubrobacterales bacterium]|nr:hypothetical protein [Solirubrobacterales bacterium]
ADTEDGRRVVVPARRKLLVGGRALRGAGRGPAFSVLAPRNDG